MGRYYSQHGKETEVAVIAVGENELSFRCSSNANSSANPSDNISDSTHLRTPYKPSIVSSQRAFRHLACRVHRPNTAHLIAICCWRPCNFSQLLCECSVHRVMVKARLTLAWRCFRELSHKDAEHHRGYLRSAIMGEFASRGVLAHLCTSVRGCRHADHADTQRRSLKPAGRKPERLRAQPLRFSALSNASPSRRTRGGSRTLGHTRRRTQQLARALGRNTPAGLIFHAISPRLTTQDARTTQNMTRATAGRPHRLHGSPYPSALIEPPGPRRTSNPRLPATTFQGGARARRRGPAPTICCTAARKARHAEPLARGEHQNAPQAKAQRQERR